MERADLLIEMWNENVAITLYVKQQIINTIMCLNKGDILVLSSSSILTLKCTDDPKITEKALAFLAEGNCLWVDVRSKSIDLDLNIITIYGLETNHN